MTQNIRGTTATTLFKSHDESSVSQIRQLTISKIGSITNVSFYPRVANPFKNKNGVLDQMAGAYRVDNKQLDYLTTNLSMMTRKDPRKQKEISRNLLNEKENKSY